MVRIARSAALARTPSQSRHHPAQRALFNPPCPGVLAAKIVEPVEVALATILPVDGRRRVLAHHVSDWGPRVRIPPTRPQE